MKQDFTFVAARALANHSAALMRPGPPEADQMQALASVSRRLALSLRAGLARLGGEAPNVVIDPPRETSVAQIASDSIAIYSVYAVAPGAWRLLSVIDADALMRLVDRAFGGLGDAPRSALRELPMSGELMAQRIETIVADHLALALGGVSVHPQRRDRDLAQVQPFAPITRLVQLNIAVSEGKRAPWLIRLVLPQAALAELTGLAPTAGATAQQPRAPANPDSAPFAAMPMAVTARLIDTRVPLRVVSRLEPGQVLFLPIARAVPVMIGSQAVAHGTIGAVDDRVAIQITQLA